MKIYYFEKLDVWQNAKDLSVTLYKLTQQFPSEEKFGIISQLGVWQQVLQPTLQKVLAGHRKGQKTIYKHGL